MIKVKQLCLLAVIVVLTSNCMPPPPKYVFYEKVPNKMLTIGTPGVSITAVDGSFKWESGKNYNLPDSVPFFNWYTTGKAFNLTTENFKSVTNENSIKVMVQTPYSTQPLFGILQFSEIITECKDKTPETRSYYIQVPESYVSNAQGGKLAVMYESYMCISGSTAGVKSTTKHGYSTWALWISDRPI